MRVNNLLKVITRRPSGIVVDLSLGFEPVTADPETDMLTSRPLRLFYMLIPRPILVTEGYFIHQ